MPISPNFTSVFEQEFEINFSQCFSNGLLKETELCGLLQQTAAKHAELGGISFSDMQQFDQAWVMTKLRIEIIERPKSGDKIIIRTWIKSMENSKSVRAMEVFHQSKKIAGSETLWVVLNTKKRIAEQIAINYDHFELFASRVATQSAPKNIYVGTDKKLLATRKIVLSDIDNVNHANNIKYLEWCLDLLEVELILDAKIKSFEMNFLRELLLYDTVDISLVAENSTKIFSGSKNGKNCFSVLINLTTEL
jgi:medium-chain acyl-[acyl-carrier-protein] hydrolase